MRILVTGITGQVGAAIVSRFGSLGSLITADRATLDLSKPNEIARTLEELKPDVIVNPAAYTAVDRAEDEIDLAFLVNAVGPEMLAKWASARGVPLVHFSTDYVFNGQGERPWREDDAAEPINAYGASKLAGEDAVRSAGGPHLIVRTSWIYSVIGQNFLRTMVRLAREREELRIVADQVGSPTSAAFIADALADIFRAHSPDLATAFGSAKNTIHLAAAGQTSWHGFANAIMTGLKQRNFEIVTRRLVPISTEDYPTKALRPLNSRLDLSHIHNVFNIKPQPWNVLLEPELDRVVGDFAH